MSAKVQYYTAATLDGFIAGVGVLTMGATTYEWILEHHPEMRTSPDRWHEFYDDRPAWSVSGSTSCST